MTDNPCAVNGSQDEASAVADQYATRAQSLSNDLLHGTLPLDAFHERMQDMIRLSFIHQAIAGTHDDDERELTMADQRRIEANIGKQYQYLDGFMSDIEKAVQKDGASLDFIPNRAALYAKSSETEYWKQAVNVDLPTLPGEQQCLGNCGCSWDLQCEYDGSGNATAVNAYWRRGKTDSCPDCVANEEQYNPLRVELN